MTANSLSSKRNGEQTVVDCCAGCGLEFDVARLCGDCTPPDPVKAERDRYRDLLETVDAHYSGSLDRQPVYVRLIREALEEAA